MKIFRTTDFIMAAAWLLAFMFSIPWIAPPDYARLAAIGFISVFAFVALGRELAGPGIKAAASPVFWGIPALWVLTLASVAWSAAPTVSFIAFATFGLAALGMLGFASGRGIFRMLILLVPPVFAVLAVLSVWAIVQYIFLPERLVNGQVRAPFANPNNFAALLMLGLLPACGLIIAASNRKIVIAAIVTAVILAAGIVIINGRAVLALSMLGVIVLAMACRGRSRRELKRLLWVAASLALALCGQWLLAQGHGHLAATSSRVAALLDPATPTVQSRLALWRASLHMIRDRVLSGTGYGTYYLFYPEYRLMGDTTSAGYMAHNDALQIWAETGIVGFLLFAVLAVMSCIRMGKVMRRTGPESGERVICLALFLGCGMVAVDSLIDFDFYCASILCLFGMMFGLWVRYSGLVLSERAVPVRLPAFVERGAGWVIVGVPLAVMLFAAQGFLRSEHLSNRAATLLMTNDWRGFQTVADAARRAGFDRDARPYMLAAELPLSILEVKGPELSPIAWANMAVQAEALLIQAEARNPRMVGIYYGRAVIAGTDKKDAEAQLRQALTIDPGHMASRMRLAALALKQGRKHEALDVLSAGLDRPTLNHDPRSYYAMTADVALAQGDHALEKSALSKLAAWNAGHPQSAAPEIDDTLVPLP